MGDTGKQLFYRLGKALEVGKYVFVTDKYLLSTCYLSTLIEVIEAMNTNALVGQTGPEYQ